MHVGQHRHADLALHFGEKMRRPFVHAQAAHRLAGTAVGLVVGGLEDVGNAELAQTSFSGRRHRGTLLGLGRAGPGDQEKRLVKTSLETAEFHFLFAC
jgi:hypothetical protein